MVGGNGCHDHHIEMRLRMMFPDALVFGADVMKLLLLKKEMSLTCVNGGCRCFDMCCMLTVCLVFEKN